MRCNTGVTVPTCKGIQKLFGGVLDCVGGMCGNTKDISMNTNNTLCAYGRMR